MAFNKRFLDPTGSGSKGTKVIGLYQSDADNAAAIKAANYFNSEAEALRRVGILAVFASDETFLAKVTVSAAGVVTLSDLDAFTPA